MFDPAVSPITHHYRPRNRNTYISITRHGEVCVRTPIKDEKKVRQLLVQRQEWIRAKLITISEKNIHVHVYGETIRFRGENFQVSQLPSLSKNLEKTGNTVDIEKYYHRFYRDEAIMTLPSRIEHYSRKMGVKPTEVRFKRMKRRWGSCDSKGVVTFNTLIMQLGYVHIDYIIVHELAHLSHMNHSKAFHQLVRLYLPDEKKLRSELRGISPL